MNKIFLNLFLIFIFFEEYGANVLPSYASKYRCHTSDPNFETCLVNNTNLGVRALKNGVPEANISAIDPMVLEQFVVSGRNSLFNINMIMKNITLYGQSDIHVTKFTIDVKNMSSEISFHADKMNMTCTYYATGRLIVIPITSAANFEGNFTDINVTLKFNFIRINRNGTDYYQVVALDYEGQIGGAHIKLEPIGHTNKASVAVLQDYFNDNDKMVLDIVYPLCKIESAIYYKDLINDILDKVPADEILLE